MFMNVARVRLKYRFFQRTCYYWILLFAKYTILKKRAQYPPPPPSQFSSQSRNDILVCSFSLAEYRPHLLHMLGAEQYRICSGLVKKSNLTKCSRRSNIQQDLLINLSIYTRFFSSHALKNDWGCCEMVGAFVPMRRLDAAMGDKWPPRFR